MHYLPRFAVDKNVHDKTVFPHFLAHLSPCTYVALRLFVRLPVRPDKLLEKSPLKVIWVKVKGHILVKPSLKVILSNIGRCAHVNIKLLHYRMVGIECVLLISNTIYNLHVEWFSHVSQWFGTPQGVIFENNMSRIELTLLTKKWFYS